MNFVPIVFKMNLLSLKSRFVVVRICEASSLKSLSFFESLKISMI